MIAIIGTSDRPCWLAEACKILLLHFLLSLIEWGVFHYVIDCLDFMKI